MDQRKPYQKPEVVESIKLEAIAGACAPSPPGKASSGDANCTGVIAS